MFAFEQLRLACCTMPHSRLEPRAARCTALDGPGGGGVAAVVVVVATTTTKGVLECVLTCESALAAQRIPRG